MDKIDESMDQLLRDLHTMKDQLIRVKGTAPRREAHSSRVTNEGARGASDPWPAGLQECWDGIEVPLAGEGEDTVKWLAVLVTLADVSPQARIVW